MPVWFAVVLGIAQGLTEFIPVSSTAHLRILPALFGQPDAGAAYTAVIQLGTLLAVVIYFARDLGRLASAALRAPRSVDGRLPWLLVLGTIPIVVAGLAFQHAVERDLRSLEVIAFALIVVGALLVAVDHHASRAPRTRRLEDLSVRTAFAIGIAQAAALVPGVSRSGATICMALLLGFSRVEAARISFLLSIPALAGAGLFELRGAMAALGPSAVPAIAVGTAVAAITGYLAIAWLLRWLGTHRIGGFGIYRIALGTCLLAALVTGMLRE